ncbi:nuclear transport factor 2 family protein [Flavobacterium sp. LC2016-12]|uniref:nuclear transport factor 2 family protein n=1 Tax=Flavobacterium sp. LC2016-12 TaxID=2783794 RepID=UPI00188CD2C8|nr:nuclear transport factor 2 family protein [Flavobacterium sp. LC2016-12]MBF4465092.1 nuclear transport factor 2 family protein [Flavobacterium sp. LC2016-12]
MKLQKSKLLVSKVILVIALMLNNVQGIKAQNNIKMENHKEDVSAITDAIENYYFKGIYEGDAILLESIFYPGTLVYGDVNGQPYFKTADLYLNGVKNRQSPKDSGKPYKGEILNIKVVNSIAMAEINLKMYEFNYRDFLSFHKINGKWYIVNKMLTNVSE